jgi:hypothetical protein
LARALALAALIALAAPGATTARHAAVTLTARALAPTPDPEDTYNPLGRRGWDVPITLEASADPPCAELVLRYAYRVTFDRRLVEAYSGSFDVPGPSFSADVPVRDAGSRIRYTAVAVCANSGEASPTVSVAASVPPHTCDDGPIRVTALRGRAWREDLDVMNKLRPLRRDDFVVDAYELKIGARSRLVLAAPECDRLLYRIDGPTGAGTGSYDRHKRGDSFAVGGGSVRARGDRHAGGSGFPGGWVEPLGERPSTYDVRIGRRSVLVRVLRGSVRIRNVRPGVVVHAGEEARVRCGKGRPCAATVSR